MKLPNADRAIVDVAKLRDYCLNPNHEEGKHKARVFAASLGPSCAQCGVDTRTIIQSGRSRGCDADFLHALWLSIHARLRNDNG